MVKRKIQTEDEARACLKAAAASGLHKANWAIQNGIDGRSLQGWARTLAKQGQKPTIQMVEILQEPLPACRIQVGRFTVEVEPTMEEARLLRLLRLVASC